MSGAYARMMNELAKPAVKKISIEDRCKLVPQVDDVEALYTVADHFIRVAINRVSQGQMVDLNEHQAQAIDDLDKLAPKIKSSLESHRSGLLSLKHPANAMITMSVQRYFRMTGLEF